LRGEVLEMNETSLKFRANQEDLRFARSVVGSVIWLHAEGLAKPADQADQAEENKTDPTKTVDAADNLPVQILMHGNQRITTEISAWEAGNLVGSSETLGACRVPLEQIYELRMGSFANDANDVPYCDWVASLAPEPQLDSGAGGTEAPVAPRTHVCSETIRRWSVKWPSLSRFRCLTARNLNCLNIAARSWCWISGRHGVAPAFARCPRLQKSPAAIPLTTCPLSRSIKKKAKTRLKNS